ncbi:hypothetical protein [Microlunatus speluncae]|uniref:hypothetical protein n=1 Tax=Microlunatus speluncae TaxID=2594267 RepID=UPI001266733B|nr:hypothetical protein [Microlunatus speluncae]
MAEATIGTVTTPTRSERRTSSRPHPVVGPLARAYLSTGIAGAIFGLGYGLSLIESASCTIQGWACAAPRALLLAAFLAAALAALVFAAHRTGLGMSWFLITAGLVGLTLASGLPLPLLVVLLLLMPGVAAGLVHLVRSRWPKG